MSKSIPSITFWIDKRKRLEKAYKEFPENKKRQINARVRKKLKRTFEVLRPEIRIGNGIEKVIIREKHRLLMDEVSSQMFRNNLKNIIPYKVNSDGKHPGMIFIPEGRTKIGVDSGFASREEPETNINVKGFWIDIFPITNAQYHQLYRLHFPSRNYPEDDMPVLNVTWFDVHKFSSALGKRLPTLKEWEKAARGPNNWIYSFGNEFNNSKAHIWPNEGPSRVKRYESNPWGIFQMSGNIWEWTNEIYCHEIGDKKRIYYNLAKGGSWRHCSWGARATMSMCFDLGHRSENVGFRCACSY